MVGKKCGERCFRLYGGLLDLTHCNPVVLDFCCGSVEDGSYMGLIVDFCGHNK